MTTLNRRYPAIQGELEDELETEDEAFFGGLAKIAGSLLGEGEEEYEDEDEWEIEGEDEAFFGGLAKIAGSLLGEGETEGEYEFEFEAEAEAEMEAEAEGETEDEFEAEAEEEAEGFVNPVRRVYRDAELMAHLATQAAQTESESEAEAFIGALIPMAAKLIPRAAQLISRNGPALIKGATKIYRQLNRNPSTRRLIKGLPVVLQRTAQSLADQAANGQPINGATVMNTLGRMTGRVLGGGRGRRAVRAVDVFNRRYHRRRRWQSRRRYPYGPRYRRGPGGYRRPVNYSRRPVRRVTRGARRR